LLTYPIEKLNLKPLGHCTREVMSIGEVIELEPRTGREQDERYQKEAEEVRIRWYISSADGLVDSI